MREKSVMSDPYSRFIDSDEKNRDQEHKKRFSGPLFFLSAQDEAQGERERIDGRGAADKDAQTFKGRRSL